MRKRIICLILVAAALILTVGIVRQARQREQWARVDRFYPFVRSPHVSPRPFWTNIDCVVVHSTAGTRFDSAVTIFQSPKSRVSAHYIVGKDGRVVQMVPIGMQSWHAGISSLDGAPRVNAYSVGIEMVNRNDGTDPYPDVQYKAVAGIIRRLRTVCDIPDSRIVSHAQIALPKGRKSDPRSFDFAKLRRLCGKV
ncbi:MAG: N-acetylmuramoyl-L-alanine amidase [Capsulimonas sp.]|uniref:N-acetylmuramoyl-L-alanine amidase n=1 Tax=Capsulimonas sp. TaxID=2494211 RepID=UPI003262FE19